MTLSSTALGSTGIDITRLGLGAWAIGGTGWKFAWGPQDDAESIATIHHAIDSGINWIDTAACYGRGHSEEVIGSVIKGIPQADRPYVFTKCGVIAPAGTGDPALVGDPKSIRREVEDSLTRLGVETIDLYQMHWPAQDGTPLEEYWLTLAELRSEGKTRFIGLSNHDVDQVRSAHAISRVDVLQPPFSALARDAAENLLPWATDNGVGVIIYSPMQSGLLTGAMDDHRVSSLPVDDWRRAHPDFTGEGLQRNLAVADALAAVGRDHGTNAAQAALAWALGWPGVSGAIVGGRHPDQIDGWKGASEWSLSPADYATVARAIVANGAGTGPTVPPQFGGDSA
ncbi:MAG: aldo/keto reductase [Candidatus Nanopelagicales bacterium]